MITSTTNYSDLNNTLEYCGKPTITPFEDKEMESFNIRLIHAGMPYNNPVWFRANCFSITLTIDALGCYSTKTNTFAIKPGTLFFSRPNMHRQLEWQNITEVYHLTFSEHFLAKYAGVALFKTFPFLLLESVVPRLADTEVLTDLSKIYLQIGQVQKENSHFKNNIIANLLTRLLLRVKQHFWDGCTIETGKDKEPDIVKQFIKNLEQHYQQLQKGKATLQLRVKDYAAMQGVHENYLYTVIKEQTGKMVSHWIAEKTILAAQSLLEDPSFTIKEIAYRLGFAYVSYFTTFFKKHTGLTPKDFRTKSNV